MFYGSGTYVKCTWQASSSRQMHSAASGRCMLNDGVAVVLKVLHHIKNLSRCVFTWRSLLPNVTWIRFETTEL